MPTDFPGISDPKIGRTKSENKLKFYFSTTIISKYLSLFSPKAPGLYRGGFQKKHSFFSLISREILSVSGKTPDNHR